MAGEGAMNIASNTGQDLVGRLCPCEDFGIFIVHVNVLAYRCFEVHASKHAIANPFVGEFGEPSVDQVDP